MEAAGVGIGIDDLVVALRRDEQADGDDHQHQSCAIEVACISGEVREALPKDAAELESEQNLGAKGQHSGFLQRGCDEFRQLHRNRQFPHWSCFFLVNTTAAQNSRRTGAGTGR